MTKKHAFMLRLGALCLLSGMLLIGCSKKNETQDPEENVAEASTEAPDKVIPLNTTDFIRLVFDFQNASTGEYQGELPCVVDFYADWCKACRMMAPIMDKMAEEFQGRILFYKVNVDENQELSNYFQIQGIPYFLFFPVKGEPIVKMGGMNEEDMRGKLEELL